MYYLIIEKRKIFLKCTACTCTLQQSAIVAARDADSGGNSGKWWQGGTDGLSVV